MWGCSGQAALSLAALLEAVSASHIWIKVRTVEGSGRAVTYHGLPGHDPSYARIADSSCFGHPWTGRQQVSISWYSTALLHFYFTFTFLLALALASSCALHDIDLK